MKLRPARIRSEFKSSNRYDEWATIISVMMATPDGFQPRPVFVVVYDDGETEQIELEELALYEISL